MLHLSVSSWSRDMDDALMKVSYWMMEVVMMVGVSWLGGCLLSLCEEVERRRVGVSLACRKDS